MRCPACGNELSEVTYETGTAHLCAGNESRESCGGLWLKPRDIKKLDDPQDETAQTLVEHQKNEARKPVEHDDPLPCPTCDDIYMRKHFYSVKKEAEVHECPGCGGMWLNAGGLERLRGEYTSVEEREAAGEKLMKGMFDPLRSSKPRSKEAKDKNR